MNRKLVILCLILSLCLFVQALAAAERTVVTALATEVNPDDLTAVSVDARITDYNAAENTLSIELIVPERYDPEEILALKIGDAIYTGGQEVGIKTISSDSGYIVLNEGDYEFSEGSVRLYEGMDMTYWIADYDDHTWTLLAAVQVPVPDHLLFLDEINPSTGESLLNPSVHNRQEFLAMLEAEKEEGPGFAANNVIVAFDDSGALALIRRFYVPWQ